MLLSSFNTPTVLGDVIYCGFCNWILDKEEVESGRLPSNFRANASTLPSHWISFGRKKSARITCYQLSSSRTTSKKNCGCMNFVTGEGRSGLLIRMASNAIDWCIWLPFTSGNNDNIDSSHRFVHRSESGSTELCVRSLLKAKAMEHTCGVTVDKQSLLGQLVDLSIELSRSDKQDSGNGASQQFAGSL